MMAGMRVKSATRTAELTDATADGSRRHRLATVDDRPQPAGAAGRLPILATVAILAPLAWMWQNSRMPAAYSVMDMGYLDYGGGPAPDPSLAGHAGHDTEQHARPDGHRPGRRPEASGRRAGRAGDRGAQSAHRGPVGRRLHRQRQLTRSDDQGPPGPAGRGAPAQRVRPGRGGHALARARRAERDGRRRRSDPGRRAGRWRVHLPVRRRPGRQLLVPLPPGRRTPRSRAGCSALWSCCRPRGVAEPVDVVAVAHTYGGVRTINGRPGDLRVPARPGERVRVRVTNTDNGPMEVWAGAPLPGAGDRRHRRARPTEIERRRRRCSRRVRAATWRLSPRPTGPRCGCSSSAATAVIVGPADAVPAPAPRPTRQMDLLQLREPAVSASTRQPRFEHFDYRIGRRPGFVRGPARNVVVDQRSPVPERADVRGARGRRRGDADREPQR